MKFKFKFFCIIFTYILLWIKYIEYLIKKFSLKNKGLISTEMNKEQAEIHISKCYPNLESDLPIINLKIDTDIKCSVIIPVYNHEDVLEETINSVLDQKCEYKFEIILVDDGSNDATKRILKKYEMYDNCKIIHQENQGIAVASTCCSGAYELLGYNNEYGIVTENSEDGIYDGLRHMLEDENLRKNYAVQAAIRGQKFSTKKTVAAVQELFEEILNEQ